MSTVAASSLIWTISRTYTQPDGKSSGALSFLQQSQHREETIWENNEPVKRHQLLRTYCMYTCKRERFKDDLHKWRNRIPHGEK